MKGISQKGIESVAGKKKDTPNMHLRMQKMSLQVKKNIEADCKNQSRASAHVPSAQEILNDILANQNILSQVKAGTERLVLPESSARKYN